MEHKHSKGRFILFAVAVTAFLAFLSGTNLLIPIFPDLRGFPHRDAVTAVLVMGVFLLARLPESPENAPKTKSQRVFSLLIPPVVALFTAILSLVYLGIPPLIPPFPNKDTGIVVMVMGAYILARLPGDPEKKAQKVFFILGAEAATAFAAIFALENFKWFPSIGAAVTVMGAFLLARLPDRPEKTGKRVLFILWPVAVTAFLSVLAYAMIPQMPASGGAVLIMGAFLLARLPQKAPEAGAPAAPQEAEPPQS